jgi:hypothetical protein
MGRIYTAVFQDVTVSAVQDLFELTCPATGMAVVHSVRVGQITLLGDANAGMLEIGLTRRTAGGSGGTGGITPSPHHEGGPTCGLTVDINHTTTDDSGATVVLLDVFNIQAGWLYVPTPEERVWIPPSGILSVELHDAPASATSMSGSITFEEID